MLVKSLDVFQKTLATYYLRKLRKLETIYQLGHEHAYDALCLFDKEWQQIQHCFLWLSKNFHNDQELTQLCLDYSQAGINLLQLRQNPEERLNWLEAGLVAAQAIQDHNAEMIQLYLLAKLYNNLAELSLAQDYACKALELALVQNNQLYQARILSTLSNNHYKQAYYEEAKSSAVQALDLSRSLKLEEEIGAALNAIANGELSQSAYQSAYDYYRESLQIAESLGRHADICLVLHNLSSVAEILGKTDEAKTYAERCAHLAREIGNHYQLTTILGILGFFACEEGRLAEAETYLQESLSLAIDFGFIEDELHAWGRIGNLRMLLDDYVGAVQAYEKALVISHQGGFRHFAALSLGCLIQAHRQLGNLLELQHYLREGLELVISLNMPSIQILYLHELAQLWYTQGRSLEAAQFMGIIEQHTEEFDRRDLESFKVLEKNLEESLGLVAYQDAKLSHSSTKVDTLLTEILHTFSLLHAQVEIT